MSFVPWTEQCNAFLYHVSRSKARNFTPNTYFYCILTDLIDSLWSIVKKSFARNPVVFSQLHSILGTQWIIRQRVKTTWWEKSSVKSFYHYTCSRKRILAGNSLLDIKERIRAKYWSIKDWGGKKEGTLQMRTDVSSNRSYKNLILHFLSLCNAPTASWKDFKTTLKTAVDIYIPWLLHGLI